MYKVTSVIHIVKTGEIMEPAGMLKMPSPSRGKSICRYLMPEAVMLELVVLLSEAGASAESSSSPVHSKHSNL